MRIPWTWLVAALLLGGAGSAAHAAWHEAKSRHFIIYADLRPAEIKLFAERLERFDQAVRRIRGMQDPPLTDSDRLTIYALRNEGAVAKLAGRGSGVRGFYSARASGSVAFVPRKAGSRHDKYDLDSEAIFFHEYAHHLHLQYSSAALPAWVVEGFAEFFATARILDDGGVGIGAPPMYRAFGLFHLDGLTLEEMLGGAGRRLKASEWELLYGRGWLLTHYLSFEPARRGQLSRYVDAIQRGSPALDAAKAAFGDLRALDRELDNYLNRSRVTYLTIAGSSLAIGPVAIRPLRPGEAALMNVHVRSRRGVNDKTAPGVAADARKAAAPFPDDPFVQTTLAEAEYDAGHYAAAEVAADRALAADPKLVKALIYKGRAAMELARRDPAKADWKAVRAWFVRANKLDTENAEPLMLFYQSYLHAGVKPTTNAVEGLVYAVALAPQDQELRINAVRQLLLEERLPEARKLFAPLAFEPHANETWRDTAAKIMAAVAGGDAKTALRLLDASQEKTEGKS